jgi:ADP-ribose pyrophosphatase YjhB (NUDIX family)
MHMPHIHELYDYVVTIFIVHDNKVLLVNHPRYQLWLPIGGHIELDEDPEIALYREIKEESGLDVRILSDKPQLDAPDRKSILTPAYVDVHEAGAPHKHISFVYFAISNGGESQLSSEHSDMRWFDAAELDEPQYSLSSPLVFYAKQALQRAAQKTM